MSGNVPTSHQKIRFILKKHSRKLSWPHSKNIQCLLPQSPLDMSWLSIISIHKHYRKLSKLCIKNIQFLSHLQMLKRSLKLKHLLLSQSGHKHVDTSCMVSNLWCIHRWALVSCLVGLQKREVPSFLSWRLRRGSLCLCCWPHNLGKLTA